MLCLLFYVAQFITSVLPEDVGNDVISETAFQVLKEEFMAAYDENEDHRIDIGELVLTNTTTRVVIT